MTSTTEITHLTFDVLVDLLRKIFVRHGVSETTAAILADNCARAERDGSFSHGIFRVPGYISTLKSGWVDGKAQPVIEDDGAALIRVDARNGFTLAASALARPTLLERAREQGVGVLAIRNSHHFSALWPDVEPFADEGLVALSFVNSMAVVVPPGGKKAIFGTNPVAFAAPRAGQPPYVFDQSSSAIANGDVQIAAREGHSLREGAGVDRDGNPTTDPRAVLDGGALLPFGGYKGASIALMVEILAAALTGGNFSREVDWSQHPGAQTPCTGQLFIVIDPARGGNGHFAERVAEICDLTREAGQERLPSDRRFRTRAETARTGIPIKAKDMALLQELVSE
ncbi:Ldh family oxidoreductase [Limoniibacter endophyticus]|nr:Ldh family oxidoreductase [Limoniibacter endophyticus]